MDFWDRWLRIESPYERADRAEKLVNRLQEHQVRRVIERLRTGTQKEKSVALELLLRKTSWERNVRRAYLRAMEQLVRKEFPSTPPGPGSHAMAILIRNSPRVAEQIALDLKLDGLSNDELFQVAGCFGDFDQGTKPFRRLSEIVKRGASAGKSARTHIELKAGLSAGRVEKLSRKWRRSRSAGDLISLHERHLWRLPKGTKRRVLLRLLGRPDERTDTHWVYVPNSATSLHIGLDKEGLVYTQLHS